MGEGHVALRVPGRSPSDHSEDAEAGTSALDLQERERSRLAFDLHDGPAQAISAALLQARLLESASGEELRQGLEELKGLLTFALDDMFGIIEQLRSRALDHEGLVSKLQAYVGDFASRDDADVTFSSAGPDVPLSDSAQIAVFRIVQEALSNARRHAKARRIDVRLDVSDDCVRCTVTDDGKGFRLRDIPRVEGPRQRYGLIGMAERARLLDGECVISSDPGGGTRVAVRIPVWRST
jgi:two-component system, NarL family, sensor histidine kinase DegS